MENEKLKMMGNIVEDKSFAFAIRIVKLCRYIQEQKKEFVLTKQLLRSGTSIGANVSEAQQGQSKRDFMAKMNVALKECGETKYWLRLLAATDYLSDAELQSILADCVEVEKLLTSIVKTTKQALEN